MSVNDCSSFPCTNNGRCIDLHNDFKCNCTDGWMGKACNIPVDPCSPFPCYSHAVCVASSTGFKCNCDPGFTGKLCGTNIGK